MMKLLFSFLSVIAAEQWAVIAVGSSGYENYRHQADSCHAYHLLKRNGVPPSNIIHLSYNDVAGHAQNPFPGKLYNKSQEDGFPTEVYEDCVIDYEGKDVTHELFQAVLAGDQDTVKKLSGKEDGKVLKSTKDDHVFLNFIDHGAPGIVAFPTDMLTAKEMYDSLKLLEAKKMYKQLLYYVEACESGSMFQDLALPSDMLIVTASNSTESSWGTYCPPTSVVDGKDLNTCLGDLFSVNWMNDSDVSSRSETIQTQIYRVTRATDKSHVTVFGDQKIASDLVSVFLGKTPKAVDDSYIAEPTSSVSSREIKKYLLKSKRTKASSPSEKKKIDDDIQKLESEEKSVEDLYSRVASSMCAVMHEQMKLADSSDECKEMLASPVHALQDLECHHELVRFARKTCEPSDSVRESSLKYFGIFAQACNSLSAADIGKVEKVAHLSKAIAEVCHPDVVYA